MEIREEFSIYSRKIRGLKSIASSEDMERIGKSHQ